MNNSTYEEIIFYLYFANASIFLCLFNIIIVHYFCFWFSTITPGPQKIDIKNLAVQVKIQIKVKRKSTNLVNYVA